MNDDKKNKNYAIKPITGKHKFDSSDKAIELYQSSINLHCLNEREHVLQQRAISLQT